MYPQMAENFLNRNCTTALCKSNEVVIPTLLEDASSQRDANCTTVSCKFKTSGETLVSKLSYSHINEIMKVDDPLARYFYEQECINSLYPPICYSCLTERHWKTFC